MHFNSLNSLDSCRGLQIISLTSISKNSPSPHFLELINHHKFPFVPNRNTQCSKNKHTRMPVQHKRDIINAKLNILLICLIQRQFKLNISSAVACWISFQPYKLTTMAASHFPKFACCFFCHINQSHFNSLLINEGCLSFR